MYLTFAKHIINDALNLPFEAADYSRFKFGDTAVAKKFGEELAHGFIENFTDTLLSSPELVIIPSPYNAIPTASGFMSNYFREVINRFLFQHQKTLLLESKIHRYNTYSVDYSQLNYTERLKLMASDTYHFHESFLNNKTCLFLDDIRVTGSHEQIIKNMLEANALNGKFIFIYYAAFDNTNIPARLESDLNTFAIKSLSDVYDIILSPSFSPNTRIIKYLLNAEPHKLLELLNKIERSVIEKIIHLALRNNYHQMPEYKTNFYTLAKFTRLYS